MLEEQLEALRIRLIYLKGQMQSATGTVHLQIYNEYIKCYYEYRRGMDWLKSCEM